MKKRTLVFGCLALSSLLLALLVVLAIAFIIFAESAPVLPFIYATI